MPCPAILVVDGAARVLAEARVGFRVVEIEVVVSEVSKLILGEAQFPGEVTPVEGESVVVFWDEGHGVVVK